MQVEVRPDQDAAIYSAVSKTIESVAVNQDRGVGLRHLFQSTAAAVGRLPPSYLFEVLMLAPATYADVHGCGTVRTRVC